MHIHALIAPRAIVRIGSLGVLCGLVGTLLIPPQAAGAQEVQLLPEEADGTIFSNVIKQPTTKTVFQETVDVVVSELPFSIKEEPTDALYQGEEEIVQQGVVGEKKTTVQQVWWHDELIDEVVLSEEVTDPTEHIVKVGSKQHVYTATTDMGSLNYSNLYTMWSTSYDGNCYGCSGRTATGTSVKHGTCAVDPKVIPLGTRMYIPGYGFCRAEDTGGAIKGMKIDLGFENIKFGWWSSRYTDVYVLTD